jgi:hypothetical protein
MENIFNCNCGFYCTSEKIFWLHKSECNKKVENDKPEYLLLGWQELRKYAMEKGIDITNKKKDEILVELQRLEGCECLN